jgi:drug/metabolite transporter (DMT)-like permease
VTAHPGIVLAIVATIVYNLGFIVEKRALGRLPALEAHHLPRLARTLFSAPAWLAGFVLICGGLVLQLLVLSLEPLTVAQPLQASGVVVTILFSRLLLHERLGRAELACIGVIAVAAALLSLSSGHGPGTEAGTHAAGAAIAMAAVPACVAVPVIYCQPRRGRRLTGVREGCCAGLIYGFAGVALKALSTTVFAAPHSRGALLAAAVTSPYLYAMLVSSAIGMCLFQVALQRSPASVVMPISLVIGTGYLVVIGSWLFHERLPASPVPLAMRLGGAVAAAVVPVILTVVSERSATRRVADVSDDAVSRAASAPAVPDPRREEWRSMPGPKHRAQRREPDEPGPPVAGPARLPDRQAAAAVPGRIQRPVQPATAPQLPDSRRNTGHAGRPGADGDRRAAPEPGPLRGDRRRGRHAAGAGVQPAERRKLR